MKKSLLSAGILILSAITLQGGGLPQIGDFGEITEKNLHQQIYVMTGKMSLFTENLTWNKCGKFEVTKISKEQGKYDSVNESAFIGTSQNAAGKNIPGFPCKPNTTYEYSLDVKGNAPWIEFKGAEWNSPSAVYGFRRLKGTKYRPTGEWTNIKGKFTTGAKAVRASVWIQMWGSSQYTDPLPFKKGQYVLIDNIQIKEAASKSFNPASPAAAPKKEELTITKIITSADGKMTDFTVMGTGKTPAAATTAAVSSDKDGIILQIDCREPLKVTPAGDKGTWSGDTLEIFFGPKKADRQLSQFVIEPGGKVYTGRGISGGMKAEWKHEAVMNKDGWQVRLHIPFSTLGWDNPKPGDSIAFNIGRQRMAAREMSSWAAVKRGFHDVENFGRLLIGPYPDGMSREQFEKSQAEKQQAEKQKKWEKLAKSETIIAPVAMTGDFSIPYLPDAVFSPPENAVVNCAVNEQRNYPLAVMNNTDTAGEYLVLAEVPVPGRKIWHNGTPFPGITLRQGLRIRDNRTGKNAIYDPLVKMNEMGSFMIPPKECGLIWLDINTTGMKPGKIAGRIRVLRLNGKGKFTKAGPGWGNYNYDGSITDFPLTLNIRNIVLSQEPAIPGCYFCPPYNPQAQKDTRPDDSIFQLQYDAGMRIVMINVWDLKFPIGKDGKFIPEAPKAAKIIRYAHERGIRKFIVMYAAYHNFPDIYGKKRRAMWPEWVKTLGVFLRKNKVDPKDVQMEISDEPKQKMIPELIEAFKITAAQKTGIRLLCTLGFPRWSIEDMEKLAPYVDDWILYNGQYLGSSPAYRNFIRKVQARGGYVGHYSCSISVRASLLGVFRRNAWIGEYYQLNGNCVYQGLNGQFQPDWKGDPGIGLIHTYEKTGVPSIRLMAMRQGVNDVKYLAKLREIGKDSPEAQAFLKTAARRVMVTEAHDHAAADRVREEAAHLILKIQEQK